MSGRLKTALCGLATWRFRSEQQSIPSSWKSIPVLAFRISPAYLCAKLDYYLATDAAFEKIQNAARLPEFLLVILSFRIRMVDPRSMYVDGWGGLNQGYGEVQSLVGPKSRRKHTPCSWVLARKAAVVKIFCCRLNSDLILPRRQVGHVRFTPLSTNLDNEDSTDHTTTKECSSRHICGDFKTAGPYFTVRTAVSLTQMLYAAQVYGGSFLSKVSFWELW